jgi:glycosyltransferase involved in cell wall biosynthesis
MRALQNPTVSVVIPTYNRAELLGRSIRSVLNQSYTDFEIIVVDDASSDDTANVVSEFVDQRITYVPLNKNIGAGGARNVGIRRSGGKFLAFQDSDDEWLPEKLARQMSIFEQGPSDLGVVYSDKIWILKNGVAKYHPAPKSLSGQLINPEIHFYRPYQLGIQATLIKRECFETVGYFNEALPAFEDLELFIRLSRRFAFRHMPEALVNYHETRGLSKDLYANWIARRVLLKLYWKELLLHHPLFVIGEGRWLLHIRRDALKAKYANANGRAAV